MTIEELLTANRIDLPSVAPGRYYATCPRCSAKRTKAHQRSKVLGVTINGTSAHWGCNHCGWKGPVNGNGAARHGDNIKTYDYQDEGGDLLFQKVRGYPKKFWQRRPDGADGWINDLGKTRRVIYRLPEVMEAIAAGYRIAVVEGERDADNLWKIGVPATCNPDGAAQPGQKPKWRSEYSEMLRGAALVVIGDNDSAGRAHVEATASMCAGVAQRVCVLDLAAHWPEMPKGGDISDWLEAGHTREELDALLDAEAKPWAPRDKTPEESDQTADDSAAYSDDALALQFADQHADGLRFVAPWSRWLEWTKGSWRVDEKLHTMSLARETCRQAARGCNE